MKTKDKTNIMHRAWGWIALAVNVFVYKIVVNINVSKEFALLSAFAYLGIAVFVGVSDILLRIENSNVSLTIFYFCALGLNGIMVYEICKKESFLNALILIALVVIESAIAVAIPYRYKIRNKIVAFFKKRKK